MAGKHKDHNNAKATSSPVANDQLETQLSEVPRDKWGHPILPIPENIRAQGVRERTARAADRVGEDAVVGACQQRAGARPVRRARHGRQGRDDPTHARASQPPLRASRRAAGAHRRGTGPVVLPAVRRATADAWRDRVLRPLLVQPGRGRTRHGLRDRRRDRPLLRSGGAVRRVPRERRHPSREGVALGRAGGASEAARCSTVRIP